MVTTLWAHDVATSACSTRARVLSRVTSHDCCYCCHYSCLHARGRSPAARRRRLGVVSTQRLCVSVYPCHCRHAIYGTVAAWAMSVVSVHACLLAPRRGPPRSYQSCPIALSLSVVAEHTPTRLSARGHLPSIPRACVLAIMSSRRQSPPSHDDSPRRRQIGVFPLACR
jgi:hypothetical protein